MQTTSADDQDKKDNDDEKEANAAQLAKTEKEKEAAAAVSAIDDAAHLRLLRTVLNAANESKDGNLDRSMLSPALCRASTMRLWRVAMESARFDGLRSLSLR